MHWDGIPHKPASPSRKKYSDSPGNFYCRRWLGMQSLVLSTTLVLFPIPGTSCSRTRRRTYSCPGGIFNRSLFPHQYGHGILHYVQDDTAGAGGEGKKGAAEPLPFFYFHSYPLTTCHPEWNEGSRSRCSPAVDAVTHN